MTPRQRKRRKAFLKDRRAAIRAEREASRPASRAKAQAGADLKRVLADVEGGAA